jgi:hypothetical protein
VSIACGTNASCECKRSDHELKLVAVTGGPGAGKTAILEMAKRTFCEHVAILPEAASIVFGGGFWRLGSIAGKKAGQRAIFYVQRELERLVADEGASAVALCDRGTLDGLAYWPDSEAAFFSEIGSTREAELRRYTAVIHLRSPAAHQGYNHENPIRIESAGEAAETDARIEKAWHGHPRRFFVESDTDFLHKVTKAAALIREEIPACCREHKIIPSKTGEKL